MFLPRDLKVYVNDEVNTCLSPMYLHACLYACSSANVHNYCSYDWKFLIEETFKVCESLMIL